MKKVRVLKDLPFAKAGVEKPVCDDNFVYFNNIRFTIQELEIGGFFKGWLSWVEEEKSLEDEFDRLCDRSICNVCPTFKSFAQIATDHFKARFDKAINITPNASSYSLTLIQHLRAALFGKD